jgi:histidine triad (HIT) family protein
MDCIFCRIVAGEIPCHTIAEDELTLAFLDIHPLSRGHTLVIPRRHSATILDATPDDLAAVARMSRHVASGLDQALQPDGISVFQNNGTAAGQDVFHYHTHLVPRWDNDGIAGPWVLTPDPDLKLDELAAQIRAAGF